MPEPLAHARLPLSPAGDAEPPLPYGRLLTAALIAFALITCFAGLNSGMALGDHECINAQAARQMVESGEWLIPQLGEIPRVRKMPLGIWLIAGASELVDHRDGAPPVTEFSARLPSALAGFGTTMVVWWLASMMFGRRAGLVAGFLWAASAAAIIFSASAVVDMVLTFFTALSFAFFWRGFMHTPRSLPAAIGFYVAFALSMMAKAPLPLITVGMALALFWLVALPLVAAPTAGERGFLVRVLQLLWQQFKRIPSLGVLWGVPLWLVIVAAWPVYVLLHYGDALTLWKMEYFDMATGGGMDRRPQPIFYYLPIVFALIGAFLLSLPEAVAAPFMQRYRRQRVGLAMAFTWGIWGLLALSLITTKRWHYPLSIMPAFCLMLAPVIDRLFFAPPSMDPNEQIRIRWTCRILPVLIAGGFIGAGIVLCRQYTGLLPAYTTISAVIFAVLAFACIAYARGRRTLSFASVNLAALILACTAWPLAGRILDVLAEPREMVAKLKAAGVTPADPLYIVDARPDSSIEFYYGYRPQRLVNELEMSKLRPNRKEVSDELMVLMLGEVKKKLREPNPVYLILKYDNYVRLQTFARSVPFRTLFGAGQQGPHPRQMVITQEGPTTKPQ